MVETRAAERAEDRDRRRPLGQRRGDGQLGVGFVLVDWRPFDRDPRGLEGGDTVLAERVAIADPQIDT